MCPIPDNNLTAPQGVERFVVHLHPVGRRVTVEANDNILRAAQLGGVDLVAACGGVGICGTCRVRVVSGELTPPTAEEIDALGSQEIALGYRLACRALPLSDVQVDIPPSSLPAAQRLQVEGKETAVEPDPAAVAIDLTIPPPHITDLRSDLKRVDEALAEAGHPPLDGSLLALSDLSRRLREQAWSVRLAVRLGEKTTHLASTLSISNPLLGLAVDLGSTKLAVYLVHLESGATLASAGAMNPQIAYGEDVVSRIAFANQSEANRALLQSRLLQTLNGMAADLCRDVGAQREQIVDAVVVGNTAMHHFFCGLPVAQLGVSPYVPAVSDALDFPAAEAGLEIAPGAQVHMPANIAGFVGADHTAALLASAIHKNGAARVLVDIGTNTEISLAYQGKIYTCSTASGPAFEGAHIRDGMRAAPGAIEQVTIEGEQVRNVTISGLAPAGICGSGILSAIAQMLQAGVLDGRGALRKEAPRVRLVDGRAEFVLATAGETAHGRDIVVTRKDVNEIQLAKGAIRTGIEVLLEETSLRADEVAEWIIAGAFGSYLGVDCAVRVGMFPNVPLERFHQVGNAAGMGAKQMLVSRRKRLEAARLVEGVKYIELTVYPDFSRRFVDAMYF
ncbi:MAG: ASKHA domain-containing protein [Anaerolineaceae bacterium]|nr:ASKHA domain-containing protein [Anaerolineaceae bacterium]